MRVWGVGFAVHVPIGIGLGFGLVLGLGLGFGFGTLNPPCRLCFLLPPRSTCDLGACAGGGGGGEGKLGLLFGGRTSQDSWFERS